MQRIVRNGELFHGEQKANSHNSGKNGLKTIVVVVMFLIELDRDSSCAGLNEEVIHHLPVF